LTNLKPKLKIEGDIREIKYVEKWNNNGMSKKEQNVRIGPQADT
jgi:hypothetical protein